MTPRPAATLLAVRPGPADPQVLMLRRPARGFFGGLWVFPGGALEPVDRSDLARRVVSGPEGADDLPWRAAALRETAEEVGLLLSDPPPPGPVDLMGEAVYREVLERGAVLYGHRLRLLSQWVTPAGLPTRYDARFYLTLVRGSSPLLPRPSEVEEMAWVSAADALARVEDGAWAMARPTVRHLRWLAPHRDVAAVWSASEAVAVPDGAPLIESDGSEVWVPLPAAAESP
ncbi:MAG: NUDIX hydrolase [Actinomycetota bacterium]